MRFIVGLLAISSAVFALGQVGEAKLLARAAPTEAGFTRLAELTRSNDRATRVYAIRALGRYGYDLTRCRGQVGSDVTRKVLDTTIGILSAEIKSVDPEIASSALVSFLMANVAEDLPDPNLPYYGEICATGLDDTFWFEMHSRMQTLVSPKSLRDYVATAPFRDVYWICLMLDKETLSEVRPTVRKWCQSKNPREALLAQELLVLFGASEQDIPYIRPLLRTSKGPLRDWVVFHVQCHDIPPKLLHVYSPETLISLGDLANEEDLRKAFLSKDPEVSASMLRVYRPTRAELQRQLPVLVRSHHVTSLEVFDETYCDDVLSHTKLMTPEFAIALLKRWHNTVIFLRFARAAVPILESQEGYPDLNWLGASWRYTDKMKPFLRSRSPFVRHALATAMVWAVRGDSRAIASFAKLYVEDILRDSDKGVRWSIGPIVYDLPAGLRERASGRLLGEGWRPSV